MYLLVSWTDAGARYENVPGNQSLERKGEVIKLLRQACTLILCAFNFRESIS